MKKKYFTLLEILIVIIIIGILAVVSIVVYDNVIEKARIKACEINSQTIAGALETYILENNQLPGSISQIPDSYIQRSYAKVMHKQGTFKTQLVYWLIDLDKKGLAYALNAANPRLSVGNRVDERVFHCPSDFSGSISSYGINSALSNAQDRAEYETIRNSSVDPDGEPTIGDSDGVEFQETPISRHVEKDIFYDRPVAVGANPKCKIHYKNGVKHVECDH
jgi:prepilin-type N-terminal cleavage/methylation domain-containing protein